MKNTADMVCFDELRHHLLKLGYKLAYNWDNMNACNWYAYLRSKIPARNCECNKEKTGIQIVVRPYTRTFSGEKLESVEVEVCGKFCGTWFKMMAYAVNPDDLLKEDGTLALIESRLVAAWNAIGTVQ